MATVVRILERNSTIMEEVFERHKLAEEDRHREFDASVKIQAWFRAARVRAYIKYLHRCANIVQKVWRGYLGRGIFRELVKQQVMIMRMNYYNAMATKIQKIWRGYYTRKYVHNYYSRKQYLEGLMVKNEIIRNELAEYTEQKAADRQHAEAIAAQKKLLEEASKRHYLISTEVVPSIYNSPFKPHPDEMEFILRSVQPRPPTGPKPKRDNRSGIIVPQSPPLPLSEPLPPIAQKLQGPFRPPNEVLKQRFKALQPTLRVQTSFTSVDEAREAMKAKEWVMRVNDNIFEPFTRRTVPYESYLHTTSKYGHLPYGTRYFREENLAQHITSSNFKTVVSPIPVFEKLNDTYAKGTDTVPGNPV
ncbi:spermatogenesis-associated protein 17-like [Saccoglossus kowalevskii]|uniref:Spermatogenesis-associated protein 17-like n=1 Tax=Saccoglossus kowalevskii TaxID=10224 RepID=A0ABM0GX35_SACKO|nr:PREDICTED: spermatogenesis-associated protein 17-like [Saccoglossus kowalevskii]